MHLISCFILTLVAALAVCAQQADPAANAALVAKLITAPTQVQRLALLNDTDFVFDFTKGVGASKGAGGKITTANAADFPAVIGNGMAMSVGTMKPCGMNTPHTHPRATEFLYVVNGTGLEVGFIEENGARYVSNTVLPGQASIFPKGSVHFQQNLGCEPLTFVAALNNVDPGVLSAAQRYFGLPPDVVGASLGDAGVEDVAGLALGIPDNLAIGVQSCLDRCKLQRVTQPTVQQQPRVSGNALPSDMTSSKRSIARRSVEVEDEQVARSEPDSSATTKDDVHMRLRVIVGVMLMGYFAIGVNWVVRHRRATVKMVPAVHYSDMVNA